MYDKKINNPSVTTLVVVWIEINHEFSKSWEEFGHHSRSGVDWNDDENFNANIQAGHHSRSGVDWNTEWITNSSNDIGHHSRSGVDWNFLDTHIREPQEQSPLS